MASPLNYSDFSNLINSTLIQYDEAIATYNLLYPEQSIPSLLNNPVFTNSLGCYFVREDSLYPVNVSCTEGCSNVTSIFSNWPNFYTCSWYPAISETLVEPNLNTTAVKTLDKLGIKSGDQEISTTISSTIANCLADYCQSSSECMTLDSAQSCSLDNLLSSNGSFADLNRTAAVTCLRDYVCGSTGSVNPDIGGLGVILALLIQYSLSFLGMFIHFLFFLRYKISQKLLLRRGKSEKSDQQLLKAKTVMTRHLEALTSALVEFQKSQCFFSATLQIAALIVIPTFEIGTHLRDEVLLKITAANAFAPIFLTLTHIDFLGGRNSMYLMILSSLCFILGTATYWMARVTHRTAFTYYTYESPAVPVMSCGNIAPFAPCFLKNNFWWFGLWRGDTGLFYAESQSAGLAVWIITSAIFLYRLSYTFYTSGLAPLPPLKKLLVTMSTNRKAIGLKLRSYKYYRKVCQFCTTVPGYISFSKLSARLLVFLQKPRSWVYIQLFLGLLALLMQLVSVIQILERSANIIVTQMSFGQIVAVGIWVPVLLEYGYLELNGASKGTEYRLKAPLVVSSGPLDVGVSSSDRDTAASGDDSQSTPQAVGSEHRLLP